MLYIYTSNSKEYMQYEKIVDVDAYFDMDISIYKDEIYTKIMRSIDNVKKRIDDVIVTPFGTTSLNNLSTGCNFGCL